MLNLDNILDENIDILNLYTRESQDKTNKNIIPYKEITNNEELQKRIDYIEQIAKEMTKEATKEILENKDSLNAKEIPSFATSISIIKDTKEEVDNKKESSFNSEINTNKEDTNIIIDNIIKKSINNNVVDSTFIENFLIKEKRKVENSLNKISKPTKKENDIGSSIYNQMKESRKEYFEKYIAENSSNKNYKNIGNIIKPINTVGSSFESFKLNQSSSTPRTLDSYFTSDKNQMSNTSIELLECVFGWIYDNLELFAAVYEEYPIIFDSL